tara:strand:+ start:1189 stop:1449 length:261 start_codon:yes stop_codon:yes gene_type:complete
MLVITSGVQDMIRKNELKEEEVQYSIDSFRIDNWGDVAEEDKESLKKNTDSLNSGGEGMVMGSYLQDRLWIIRNSESTTVLLPSEY